MNETKLIVLAVLHKQGVFNSKEGNTIEYDNYNFVVAEQNTRGEYISCDCVSYKVASKNLDNVLNCPLSDVTYKEIKECYFDKFGKLAKLVLK